MSAKFFLSCLLFLDGIDGPAWCQSSCNDKHFIFGLLRTNQYGNPSPRNTFPLIGVTQKNLNIDMGFIFLSTRSNAFLFQSFSLPGRRFQTQKMVSTPRLYLTRGLISHQTGLNDIINDCNNPDK